MNRGVVHFFCALCFFCALGFLLHLGGLLHFEFLLHFVFFAALRAVSLGLTDFKVVIYLLQARLDKINSHFKIFQFFQN